MKYKFRSVILQTYGLLQILARPEIQWELLRLHLSVVTLLRKGAQALLAMQLSGRHARACGGRRDVSRERDRGARVGPWCATRPDTLWHVAG